MGDRVREHVSLFEQRQQRRGGRSERRAEDGRRHRLSGGDGSKAFDGINVPEEDDDDDLV